MTIGILLDLILISILILNIYIGYKKGLINVAINIFAFLISIVLSLVLYKPISNIIINNTQIDDKIREAILNNNEDTQIDENANENETIIDKYITNQIDNIANEAKNQATELLANNISIKSVQILTWIILFIGIRIILIILKMFTDIISNFPIIKQFNKAGGILYGVIKSLVIIYLLLTILFFVVSANSNGIIKNAIDNSYITKLLYENNLIIKYCLLENNLL